MRAADARSASASFPLQATSIVLDGPIAVSVSSNAPVPSRIGTLMLLIDGVDAAFDAALADGLSFPLRRAAVCLRQIRARLHRVPLRLLQERGENAPRRRGGERHDRTDMQVDVKRRARVLVMNDGRAMRPGRADGDTTSRVPGEPRDFGHGRAVRGLMLKRLQRKAQGQRPRFVAPERGIALDEPQPHQADKVRVHLRRRDAGCRRQLGQADTPATCQHLEQLSAYFDALYATRSARLGGGRGMRGQADLYESKAQILSDLVR